MNCKLIPIVLCIGLAQTGFATAQNSDAGSRASFFDITVDPIIGPAWVRLLPNSNPDKDFRFIAYPGGTPNRLDIDGEELGIASFYRDAKSGTFSVSDSGVGIGTRNPAALLHIYGGGLSGFPPPKVRVENVNLFPQVQTMFELVNFGPARFELNNTQTNQTWAFQTNNSDGFLINRLGSGGNEMSIRKTGLVTMGPGGKLNFLLDPAGNLTIDGALTQNCDRNKKESFEEIDCQQVLESVARLPITTWRYKDDPQGVRHVGPTAQDFRREFGMGQDDSGIAAVDSDGVALAAIQALNERMNRMADRMADQMATKDRQLAEAERRIAELESIIAANDPR